jgi:PPOX class probable F420-dependent enzyme
MDVSLAQDYLRHHHRAVLATSRSDGRPQLSPVLATLDDDGRVVISTPEPTVKVRNVRRDPHVSLVVMPDTFFGDWVQVEGTAEVVPQPDALEILVAYYRSISGEHPDWAEYRAAMTRDRRVVLRFAIDRAGPDISG